MVWSAWLFLLLGLCFAQDQESFISKLENMKTCPFPTADNIYPCTCKTNEHLQVFLKCNINQDMDGALLKRLNAAFACKKDIHMFNVNLNGHNWVTDFSSELLGQFQISYFNIFNYTSIVGDIKAEAFNGSSFSLTEFNIASSESKSTNRVVETGAFSKIQTLQKVSLGNAFGTIKSKAFFYLPNFQQLVLGAKSISTIETDAFEILPSLKILDLSSQNLSSLPMRALSNLSNLTELNLSENMIEKIEENTFYNIPKLVKIDLSNNPDLKHVGNMFVILKNSELVVNLANTGVIVLLKESFKPFIETVTENKGKGYIDMSNVPLQCSCDAKWLTSLNLNWRDVFQNSNCKDGLKLQEVNGTILEHFCPPDTCPGYNAGSGQMQMFGNNNDAQCSEPYTELTDSWRKVKYMPGGDSNCNSRCDKDDFSVGWYRFLEPAGTKIPIAPPEESGNSCDVCGTGVAAWVRERRDPKPEEGVIDINLCFAWTGGSCHWKVSGKSVACEESNGSIYYLYSLNKAPICNGGYCSLAV